MNNHVVSLELAKQLKENGYPQNTEFYWWEDKIKDKYTTKPELCYGKPTFLKNVNVYSAPLSSELGEELPKTIMQPHRLNIGDSPYSKEISLKIWNEKNDTWDIGYNISDNNGMDVVWTQDMTEANCRAKMWLYLKQNNLICN